MQPRLFLSHSSKDAALTQAVAAALAQPLPARPHPGYEVLLDVSCLAAGEDWPIQLHVMMAYAHAGLLLFTPQAITRPNWILKEAYILTWRRSLDPTFKVFYALLDGVTPADITAAGFEPAHLALIQALHATTAQDIANEVRTIGPTGPSALTPFEELTLKVAHHLKAVDNNLGFISGKLGLPALPWQLDPQRKEAAQIAARLIQGQFGSYQGLRDIVDELISFNVPPASLRTLLKWMAPYWLTAEAAGRFSAVVQELWENGRGGLAAVGGNHLVPYTALMLVDRVRPFAFSTRVARIEFGSHQNDADYYTAQICDWIRDQDEDGTGNYGDNDDVMQKLRAEQPSLFVPIAPVDPATLTALRKRFPNVVFLIWTKPVSASDGDIVSLLPDIDAAREATEYGSWRNAHAAVKQISN